MTEDKNRTCYAIVPAAGRSQRMGAPKLLLPWTAGLVIDAVLKAWTTSRVQRTAVVIRQDDTELLQACKKWDVDVVAAESPDDMKASVQIGLQHLTDLYQPMDYDACFVAPADLPTLTASTIDRLIDAPIEGPGMIMAPRFGDASGHPVLLPWALTNDIFQLAPDQGVNHVVKQNPQQTVQFLAGDRVQDIDTPDAYHAMLDAAQKRSGGSTKQGL